MLVLVLPRSEVEVVEGEADAEAIGHRLEGPHAFGHDLGADAVTGDDGDAMGGCHEGISVDGSGRAGRTTMATPMAVRAMPASMSGVSDSSNIAHAMSAVQGGTR